MKRTKTNINLRTTRGFVNINSLAHVGLEYDDSHHSHVVLVTNLQHQYRLGYPLTTIGLENEKARDIVELLRELIAINKSGKPIPMSWDDFNESPLSVYINERPPTAREIYIERMRKAEKDREAAIAAENQAKADIQADNEFSDREMNDVSEMIENVIAA